MYVWYALITLHREPKVMLHRRTISTLSCIIFVLFSYESVAAPPPPNINQCKTKWVLTGAQGINFGAFAIESGAGTLTMDNAGGVTSSGAISLSTTIPTTAFTVTATNTKSLTVCGTLGFTISGVLPTSLTGPGTMPLNVLMTAIDSIGTTLVSNAALPQTLNTANLPVTLAFHGNLSTTFPQAAGLYSSPAITVDLDQSGTVVSAISTATNATSLTPISLIETVALNFGTVAGGGLAGTVIVDTLGARSVTGDAQIIAVGPGNAGAFQITGEPSLTYLLTITGPAVLENAPGDQMSATAFTNSSAGILPAGTGIELFQVGATLNLAPLQPAGSYSTATGGGSPYTVTVNYN